MSESDNLYEFLPREALSDWAEVFGDKRRRLAAEEGELRITYNRLLVEFLRPSTPEQLARLNQGLAQQNAWPSACYQWHFGYSGYACCPCCGQRISSGALGVFGKALGIF